MLRNLVRSYYRLRYFPRLLTEMLTRISAGVDSLHRQDAEMFNRLMSAHEEKLAGLHDEVASFCDDAIRAMVTVSASIGDIQTRIQALQHKLQHMDNSTLATQGQVAALQQSFQAHQDGHQTADQAVPRALERMTELVQHQATQISHIETLLTRRAGLASEPQEPNEAAPATGNGSSRSAGDDDLLSRS